MAMLNNQRVAHTYNPEVENGKCQTYNYLHFGELVLRIPGQRWIVKLSGRIVKLSGRIVKLSGRIVKLGL